MERADVVVIGAGVMGTATASALGEREVDTLLLEQFRIGHARGSSHGPTRIFRLSYRQPDYVRLARHALQAWRELEDAAGERMLVRTGGVDIGPVAEECALALEECGAPHEWLPPREAGARFPAIDFSGFDRVLYHPDGHVCLADRTVAAQARLARERGVQIREETEVLRIEIADDRARIATVAGEIEARVAVVTAGPWAASVLARTGSPAPPLAPVLQHVTYFTTAGGEAPEMPTLVEWAGGDIAWYVVPAVDESPGVKVGQHAGGVPVDPRDGPFRTDSARELEHAAYVGGRLPGLDPSPVASETCLYTMTPDEDFVLDRAGSLVVGAGFSGHGFKFAPLIGEILADLATGVVPDVVPDVPLERFALDRASLRVPVPPTLPRRGR